MITLTRPFPASALPQFYRWHKYSSSIISGKWCAEEDFTPYFQSAMDAGMSWGVERDGVIVAGVVWLPIWRGGQLLDGELHCAQARSEWGKGVLDGVAQGIFTEIFTTHPSVQRLSVSIPSPYAPSIRLVERLGFRLEGVLRRAVSIAGEIRDVNLYAYLRSDHVPERA